MSFVFSAALPPSVSRLRVWSNIIGQARLRGAGLLIWASAGLVFGGGLAAQTVECDGWSTGIRGSFVVSGLSVLGFLVFLCCLSSNIPST